MIYFLHEPTKEYFHNVLGFQRRRDEDISSNPYIFHLYGEKGGRPRDVIPASNEYAYRKRVELEGRLILPFMSYRFLNSERDTEIPVFKQARQGVNVTSLDLRVTAEPHIFHYEGLFICNRSSTLYEAYERFWRQNRQDVIFEVAVRLRKTDEFQDIPVRLVYVSIEKDPATTEGDWLEKNNLRVIELNFDIYAFMLDAVPGEIKKIETIEFELRDIRDEIDAVDNERFLLNKVTGEIDKFPTDP